MIFLPFVCRLHKNPRSYGDFLLIYFLLNNENKKQDTHKNILPHNSWRSGGDSNPRTGDPSNDLANRPLQPLEYRSA